MHVAVVGAGIVGLSASRFLIARGHRVTLFEQYPLFHDKGSSHGRTRIVRRAYPDPFYTACMLDAYPLWGDLERESGAKLVHEVGLLYFGDRDSPRVKSMAAGLAECKVPHEILDAAAVGRIFPALQLFANECGVFTPQAGWVNAAEALQATYRLATSNGLEIRKERANPEHLEREFDAFVAAPGGWIRDFVDVPVKVTVETFGYADAQVEGPVWIDDTDYCYGFPSDDLGLKLGAHIRGYEQDPHDERREPDPELQRVIEAKVRQRFNLDAPVRHWKGCVYTSTATEDFLLGRLGSNGFYASACSGHGFKTGPWVGRLLADFVEQRRKPEDFPRFCPA